MKTQIKDNHLYIKASLKELANESDGYVKLTISDNTTNNILRMFSPSRHGRREKTEKIHIEPNLSFMEYLYIYDTKTKYMIKLDKTEANTWIKANINRLKSPKFKALKHLRRKGLVLVWGPFFMKKKVNNGTLYVRASLKELAEYTEEELKEIRKRHDENYKNSIKKERDWERGYRLGKPIIVPEKAKQNFFKELREEGKELSIKDLWHISYIDSIYFYEKKRLIIYNANTPIRLGYKNRVLQNILYQKKSIQKFIDDPLEISSNNMKKFMNVLKSQVQKIYTDEHYRILILFKNDPSI